MEEAFSCSYSNFSADFNVNGKINFSCQSWSLNINDTNSLNILFILAILYNVDKIFSLSWLTNHNNSLSFDNIIFTKLYWVQNIYFFESF